MLGRELSPVEIQAQIYSLQTHLSSLTHGHFRLASKLKFNIFSLQQHLTVLMQPTVVNIVDYYRTDKYFEYVHSSQPASSTSQLSSSFSHSKYNPLR